MLHLVRELGPGLVELGSGGLFFAAGLGDLEDWDAELAFGEVGAVGVRYGSPLVAEVAAGGDGGELIVDGGFAGGFAGLDLLGGGG